MVRAKGLTRREMLQAAGALGAGALLSGCAAKDVQDSSAPDRVEADADALASSDPAGSSDGMPDSMGTESTEASGEAYKTLWLYNPVGVTEGGTYVDSQLKVAKESAGLDKPALVGTCTVRVENMVTADEYGDVNQLFYDRGWADGLPIVPPTEERVSRMVRGCDLPREEVVATLAPLNGQATIEKIAANAVMAGCRPAYMPVLIAAVKAIADPAFDLTGVSTTTSPNATMVVVNGPIAGDLDINAKANALGRGWRANATIGRALHLIQHNVGGSWPALSDYSTLGMPGDFAMALAENADESPWEPISVEAGFNEDENVVTVMSAEGMQQIVDIGCDAQGFLDRVVNVISGREIAGYNFTLVITPFTAKKLADAGWDKAKVRDYIAKNTRVTEARAKQGFEVFTISGVPDIAEVAKEPDEDGLYFVPFVGSLSIVVAGGVGEKNELMPMWSKAVSRAIDLPANWDDIRAS